VKIVRNILIVVASVVALLFGLIFYSFWRAMPMKADQPLSGGAVQVKDGIVSVGVIPAGDGQVILVDCGNDPKAAGALKGLERLGYGRDAVKAVLLTHAHSDHFGGCGAFPNAQIFAMAPEQPVLEGRAALRSPIGRLIGKKDSGIHVARFLQDGDTFPIGNVTVTAYLVPGHTDGSAAYLAAGTLYMGDSADAARDGTLMPAKPIASNDREQNRESLRKLAQELAPRSAEIQFLEFAHSGPLRGIGPLLDFAKKTGAKQ
jgi:glyoxylase-like metal-dependent hydrolase (beta-lactamase superfamily II)